MWHRTSAAQGQKCPVKPSWRLWLHRKAVPLQVWSFLESLQASEQGISSRAKNPSKAQKQGSPDGVWGHVGDQMRLESGVGEDKAGGGGRSQQHM